MTPHKNSFFSAPKNNTSERQLRRISGFRPFWWSRTISSFGSALTVVILPILVYQMTSSPVLVALVAGAGTLPYLAFGLLAGAVADRFKRRGIMITSELISGLALMSVVFAAMTGTLTPAHVISAALISSSATLFFEAAGYGLVPSLVGKELLAEANSSLYLGTTVARVSGSAAAAAFLASGTPLWALAVDGLTFIASILLLRTIALPPRPSSHADKTRYRTLIREGLSFLWNTPALRTLTMIGTLLSFSGGAIIGQLTVYADQRLHLGSDDTRIGFLYAAWTLGGVAGAALLPQITKHINPLRLLGVALPLCTLMSALIVLSTNWIFSIIAITSWGAVYLMVLMNTMNFSQQSTPSHLQGRVSTTRRTISSGLGVPLGGLVAGVLTSTTGIAAGMSLAIAAGAIATALCIWQKPST